MKILIFAGTTEGRTLIDKLILLQKSDDKQLNSLSICACTATEYGKDVLEKEYTDTVEIKAGRLNQEEMKELMINRQFDVVVDATHPYATEVTKNIKLACESTNNSYIRLLRDKTEFGDDCIFTENTQEAVQFLKKTSGNVLLTVGSKELAQYTELENFENRLYARVLPMMEVIESCNSLGFAGKHLICMQGPFSCDMNIAMLNQLDCKYLVTKDTGKEGGAYEKYLAAKEARATLIVVGRSNQETGLSIKEVITKIVSEYYDGQIDIENIDNMDFVEEAEEKKYELADWFPMFVNLNDRNVAVIGAGKIAFRRIKTLLQFSCNLRIIAKDISVETMELVDSYRSNDRNYNINRSIEIYEKEFDVNDIIGADIVVTATNNSMLNKKIGQKCKEVGILVNIADNKEECDFFFPGIAVEGSLVAGVTAQGKNHSLAKKASASIRRVLADIK